MIHHSKIECVECQIIPSPVVRCSCGHAVCVGVVCVCVVCVCGVQLLQLILGRWLWNGGAVFCFEASPPMWGRQEGIVRARWYFRMGDLTLLRGLGRQLSAQSRRISFATSTRMLVSRHRYTHTSHKTHTHTHTHTHSLDL